VPEPRILWEDEDLRAIVKPLGVSSESCLHPGEFLIHRLDQPTSGVLLLARNQTSAQWGSELFARRSVEKYYWVIPETAFQADEGRFHHWLSHQQKGNKSFASAEPLPGQEEAWLDYQLRARGDRYNLYEIRLWTGRTHQIRAQFAAEGHPIRGDLKYGARRSLPGGGIDLLARHLCFLHPRTHQQIDLIAEPPEGDRLWAALASSIIPPS